MSHSDLMRELSQMLNHTEQTLVQAQDLDSAAQTKLDSLTSDSQKLERTVQELLDQVEFIKNSDIRGEDLLCRPLWAAPNTVPPVRLTVDLLVGLFSCGCQLIFVSLSLPRGVGQRHKVLPAVSGGRSPRQRLHHRRRQPSGGLGRSTAAHGGQDEPNQRGVPEETRRACSET